MTERLTSNDTNNGSNLHGHILWGHRRCHQTEDDVSFRGLIDSLPVTLKSLDILSKELPVCGKIFLSCIIISSRPSVYTSMVSLTAPEVTAGHESGWICLYMLI